MQGENAENKPLGQTRLFSLAPVDTRTDHSLWDVGASSLCIVQLCPWPLPTRCQEYPTRCDYQIHLQILLNVLWGNPVLVTKPTPDT
jgi:hypothetical protein